MKLLDEWLCLSRSKAGPLVSVSYREAATSLILIGCRSLDLTCLVLRAVRMSAFDSINFEIKTEYFWEHNTS